MGQFEGEPGVRVCIKGVQYGSPKYHALENGLGHCYVLPGRVVIVDRDQPDGVVDGREFFLRRAFVESEDVPHAYQYDGGHYRLRMHQPRRQRDICCYSRSDRDQLAAEIERAWGGRPKRPFPDIV